MLCEGLAPEFLWFLKYCRDLGFDEQPDYKEILHKFNDLVNKRGFYEGIEYDW